MTMATPDMALVPTGNRGLELGFTGNLGNIDAYISAVNRLPMLTHEEEMSLARRLQQNNDLDAAQKMVLSHLRLVVSIARGYLGYGLPHACTSTCNTFARFARLARLASLARTCHR